VVALMIALRTGISQSVKIKLIEIAHSFYGCRRKIPISGQLRVKSAV
jgi:hypothetical protein